MFKLADPPKSVLYNSNILIQNNGEKKKIDGSSTEGYNSEIEKIVGNFILNDSLKNTE
jgi:hypothetical protein